MEHETKKNGITPAESVAIESLVKDLTAAAVEVKRSVKDFSAAVEKIQSLVGDLTPTDEAGKIDVYNLGVEKATALFKELATQKILTRGDKDAFIWFFGDPEHRTDKRPAAIVWNGSLKKFAYFVLLVNLEYYLKPTDINWKYLTSIFRLGGRDWRYLSVEASKIMCGGNLPKNFIIESLKVGIDLLTEFREKCPRV